MVESVANPIETRIQALEREMEFLTSQVEELREDLNTMYTATASRFWFVGFNPFGGFRHNVLPWLGSDGNETWCRQTLVIPFFGLFALIIGLKWHLLEECLKKDMEEDEELALSLSEEECPASTVHLSGDSWPCTLPKGHGGSHKNTRKGLEWLGYRRVEQ